MSDGRPLAPPPPTPPAPPAATLAESLAAPAAALAMPIHTRIRRSKSKIVRDANKRSRRPVLERVLAAFLPLKKDVNNDKAPLKRVPSPRTIYAGVKGWKGHGCGQSWEIYDILILSAALAITLFLIGFTVWVTIISLRNPNLGNGTVVPNVGVKFGETVGWIGATVTTTVATTMATSVRSAPMEAKASSVLANVKVVPTFGPRVGGECRVNGRTGLSGWRFTPGGCEE